MRRRIASLAAAALIGLTAPLAAQPKTVAELEAEVARLREQVRALAAQLEGTAKPINLGRTSLAAVHCSSVNGGRDQANGFYGVRNLFDDGDNIIDNINYHYWLGDGGAAWVEILFDEPVTVAAIHVEGRTGFSARIGAAKGGEQDFRADGAELKPEKPLGGVTRVRLIFGEGGGNIRVDEIRVMGFPAAGAKYRVGKPRIHLDVRNVEPTARARFEEWRESLIGRAEAKTTEDDKHFVCTFTSVGSGAPVCRVAVEKATGRVTVTPLVKLVPAEAAAEPKKP